MADLEKSAVVVSPARVVIDDSAARKRSGEQRRRIDGGVRSRSSSFGDEITPVRNSTTVPIEYRTL